jgi:carboxymethylenebutenolidase
MEPFTITTPDGPMPAHLWLPPAGSGPGVLLIQEIFGVSRYLRARADDLAALGYVVLAPELFWRLGVDEVPNGPDMLAQGMSLSQRFDWSAGVSDGVAALTALREHPDVTGRVGILGFCFGGGLAFNLAAVGGPDALVAYYGSALPRLLDLAPAVAAPSLHHFGTADAYLDTEKVDRISAAVVAHGARVVRHEGAGHAFDNPDFIGYHEVASRAAWAQTTAFLTEHLQG